MRLSQHDVGWLSEAGLLNIEPSSPIAALVQRYIPYGDVDDYSELGSTAHITESYPMLHGLRLMAQPETILTISLESAEAQTSTVRYYLGNGYAASGAIDRGQVHVKPAVALIELSHLLFSLIGNPDVPNRARAFMPSPLARVMVVTWHTAQAGFNSPVPLDAMVQALRHHMPTLLPHAKSLLTVLVQDGYVTLQDNHMVASADHRAGLAALAHGERLRLSSEPQAVFGALPSTTPRTLTFHGPAGHRVLITEEPPFRDETPPKDPVRNLLQQSPELVMESLSGRPMVRKLMNILQL
ncbi:MAG: hypothetical protein AAF772_03160 [Acidobacteriota bacterium]